MGNKGTDAGVSVSLAEVLLFIDDVRQHMQGLQHCQGTMMGALTRDYLCQLQKCCSHS